MPNWCENEVTVVAKIYKVNDVIVEPYSKDQIKEFKEYVTVGKYEFSFDAIIPMPENVKDTNWWSIENWGTKWDADDVQVVDEDEDSITYSFDTAWSPPEPICEALRDKFPDLHISWFYRESGMEIAGYL
jgi:hypothetical protein